MIIKLGLIHTCTSASDKIPVCGEVGGVGLELNTQQADVTNLLNIVFLIDNDVN